MYILSGRLSQNSTNFSYPPINSSKRHQRQDIWIDELFLWLCDHAWFVIGFAPLKKIITPWLRDYVIEILKKYADVIGVISVISVIGVIGVICVICVIGVIGVIGEIDNRNG